MLSDMAEVHQALAAGAVTLHSKIVSRVPQTDEQGADLHEALRDDCRAHAARRDPPEEPQGALRDGQQGADQEGDRRRHRHRLSPHRTEGDGAVRRRDHAARLPPRVRSRYLVRQGRHGHPEGEGGPRRRDAQAREGLRAAVSGRPHHPAGKVQQGDRRLVALRRPGRERDDEGDFRPRRSVRTDVRRT